MFGLFDGAGNDIVDEIEAVLRPMAGMAIAKKFALHDVVGDVNTWQADLEQAVLSLNDVVFQDIQIIGTYAFGDETWVWAWGNQGSNFPDEQVRDSLVLKKLGEEKQIAWLVERKFELDEADVEAIAAVAVGVVQADGYYLAVHDAGIVAFALHDERLQQALSADNPTRAAAVISETVATFVLYQQDEAIGGYLRQVGYHTEQTDSGKRSQIVATRDNNVLKIDFERGFFRHLSIETS